MSPQGNRVYCDVCTAVRERKRAIAAEKKLERRREQMKKWYRENKEEAKEKNRLNRSRHLEQRKQYDRMYHFYKKKKIIYQKKYGRKYPGRKDQKDPVCNFYRRISCGLWGALKKRGFTKRNVLTEDVLGAPIQEVWGHLTSTYKINYGIEWGGQPYHIDHMVPLSTAKTKENILKLYHYTNLQMLTPEDTKIKSNNLNWKSPYQEISQV